MCNFTKTNNLPDSCDFYLVFFGGIINIMILELFCVHRKTEETVNLVILPGTSIFTMAVGK